MTARLLRLLPQEETRKVARFMPEPFSTRELEQLLRWASRRNFTLEQVRFSVASVRDWAAARPTEPKRRDWVRFVQGAMRAGWSLRGFRAEQARQATKINPRTGLAISAATPLTDSTIERVLIAQAAKEKADP